MMNDVLNADLFNTMQRVEKLGGAIFYDRVPAGSVNATAGGTGTARTSITTSYSIPNDARELLAIMPGVSPTADAAADTLFAMADIQGTSYKFQPQQVLCPVGSVTLSVGAKRMTPQEWFMTRAKVVPGDQYDWGITPLVANTHNFKAWVDVMYSTVATGLPALYSQVSSVQAFKAAGSNAAGTLTLTAANRLHELCTGLQPEAATVGNENQIVSTNVQCSALTPVQSMTYGQDAPAVVTATSGDTQVPQLSRYMPIGHRFKITNPLLTYTCNIDVATSNNLNVAHMVRYTSF